MVSQTSMIKKKKTWCNFWLPLFNEINEISLILPRSISKISSNMNALLFHKQNWTEFFLNTSVKCPHSLCFRGRSPHYQTPLHNYCIICIIVSIMRNYVAVKMKDLLKLVQNLGSCIWRQKPSLFSIVQLTETLSAQVRKKWEKGYRENLSTFFIYISKMWRKKAWGYTLW